MERQVSTDGPARVLVGGYTADLAGHAVGVTSLVPVADRGGLQTVDTLELPSPTYLVAHPDQPWVFAVSESDPGRVHSLLLHEDGALEVLSSAASGGDGACHLALSPDRGHLLVAHYGSGSVASFAVSADGRLGERLDLHQLTGRGPDTERQNGPHAHQVVWDGDEVLVPDLGSDRVHRLWLDADGRLSVAGPAVQLAPGQGPRHLVVVGDQIVVAAELSGELWLGRRDDLQGWQHVLTVPSSAVPRDGDLYPSALRADGNLVFVANRGPGTIGVFTLDAAGTLTPTVELPCGGSWPRDVAVTATHLWVANQTDDVLTVLTRPDLVPAATVPSPSPACVLLLGGPGR